MDKGNFIWRGGNDLVRRLYKNVVRLKINKKKMTKGEINFSEEPLDAGGFVIQAIKK